MNFAALFANLKTNPVMAIGGLMISIGSSSLFVDDPVLKVWAGLIGAIGGVFVMFGKQSTTTGGTAPNAVAAKDTLPPNLLSSDSTTINQDKLKPSK